MHVVGGSALLITQLVCTSRTADWPLDRVFIRSHGRRNKAVAGSDDRILAPHSARTRPASEGGPVLLRYRGQLDGQTAGVTPENSHIHTDTPARPQLEGRWSESGG